MIELRAAELVFGRGSQATRVLGPIDLTVEKGEILGLVGPSGSGKTSLLNLVGGLERASAGTVSFDGRNLGDLSDEALSAYRCDQVGFVFQSFHLQPERTVLQNLLIPLYFSGRSLKEGQQHAAQLLGKLGLEDYLQRKASQLSGGQRQRVAFARALMNQPSLLLADEPVGNLDQDSADLVMQLLVEQNQAGLTIILATHDQLLLRAVTRSLRLAQGLLQEPVCA